MYSGNKYESEYSVLEFVEIKTKKKPFKHNDWLNELQSIYFDIFRLLLIY